jgi:hypothetical protein
MPSRIKRFPAILAGVVAARGLATPTRIHYLAATCQNAARPVQPAWLSLASPRTRRWRQVTVRGCPVAGGGVEQTGLKTVDAIAYRKAALQGTQNLGPFSRIYIYIPPLTANTCPVIKLERGLARNATASAISSGLPNRPIGVCAFTCSNAAGGIP